ncbi:MAG: FG-GAP-like repeat-containing protein [Candidatus Eisenbacteria bacterium]
MPKQTRFFIAFAALLVGMGTAGASDAPTYFYYQGERVELELDPGRLYVRVVEGTPAAAVEGNAPFVFMAGAELERTSLDEWRFLVFESAADKAADARDRVEAAIATDQFDFVSPVFRGVHFGRVAITPDLLVRFAPGYRNRAGSILAGLEPSLATLDPTFGGMEGALKLRTKTKDGFEVLAIANRLAEDPRIAWAEPDFMITGRNELTPNDPGFSDLWGIKNTGQFGGTPDMDMDGDTAWDITTGDSTIIVLILDTGVQQDHPDLNQVPGRDFTTQNYFGGPGNECDNHGTTVAGCVSAVINNSLGTVGIAPDCRIASARIGISTVPCEGTWSGQYSWSVDALDWAMTNGFRVTNNSNSYGNISNALNDKYAETRAWGMVHFASAGNNNVDLISYPSSLPTVMSIMALTPTGARASFSSWGNGLAFGAPGTDVYTTDRTGSLGYSSGDYAFVQGTSFSSPYSAGVAALLLSRRPELSAPNVEGILKYTCVDLGAEGYDLTFGWGFVNAEAALGFGGWYDASESPVDDDGNGAGVVWLDFDGGADLDLYIVNNGTGNRLVRQGPNGWLNFTSGPVGDAGNGAGAAAADYDNDGDEDIYLANDGANRLFRNDDETFVDATSGPLGDAGTGRSVAWADIENDGDLDLYLANNGANKLFRNDGGTFVDATAGPLGDGDDGRGAVFGDYDGDGDLDLYLVDNGANNLLENDGSGSFTDVTPALLADAGDGYGGEWGDVDNDGDLDLYLSNDGANKLFVNLGGGSFSDGTGGVLGDAGNGRSVGFADADNDGDLDLYLVNSGSANRLLRNDGGLVFADVTVEPLDDAGTAAGMAWGDYSGSGMSDIYLAKSGANELYRNVSYPANSWVGLRLIGVASNRSSVGARARVVANGAAQIREVTAGSGYLSQRSLHLDFGLGSATVIDTIHVEWPSGLTKTFTNLPVDSLYTIRELTPPVVRVTSPNGGEEWGQGATETITWTSTGGVPDWFFIEYSTSGGAAWDSVHYEAGPGSGSYDWLVPTTPSTQALVRITMENGDGTSIDTSDGFFSIKAIPVVTVTAPNGGELFEVGTVENVTWTNTGEAATAHTVEYSADAGAGWTVLADSLPGDGGSLPWTVSDTPSLEALVRVTLFNAEGSASDESDAFFSIAPEANVSTEFADGTVSPLDDAGAGRGAAWGDFDGDTDPDLYLVNSDGPNRLFENQGGVFVDVTGAQLGDVGDGYGAAWGDYDNDGDPDLYLANSDSGNKLFRNDAGTFVNVTASPVGDLGKGRTTMWIDAENDGDLDLYLINVAGGNKLFENDGGGTFTDGTSAPINSGGTKWGGAWADYDNDGDLDLYVARLGTNQLFRNEGYGNFTNVTSGPAGDGGLGFGAAWGDYDNDGDFDLYVTNQGPNVLLRNDGGTFVDATSGPLGDVGKGCGASWADYDNDGDLDLYLANDGYNRLFRNDGAGVFADAANTPLLDAGSGQSVTWADADRDGDLDLYVTNLGANKYFRNDLSSGAHWIHVTPVGTVSNRMAIGARVRVVAGGLSRIREISGGGGYLGQDSPEAEFGLGAAATVDTIEISWPSGAVQTLAGFAADQFVQIVEPAARWVDATTGPLGDTGFGQGAAWGDYDGDGDHDLYVSNSGGANVMLRNEGAGAFSDVTGGPLGDGAAGAGVAWADMDDDGDLDLSLVNAGSANKFFRNDGGGTMIDGTSGPLGDSGFGFGTSWSDYDGDGDADLYVVNAGSSNKLFRNDGGGAFVDATTAVVGDAIGFGFTAAWGDYDNDGDGDLYIGNGFGPNKLIRNDGAGVFTDITAGPLADGNSTYGVAWGDYDNDGDLDLYLANELAANRLLRNDGGTFVDATSAPLGDTGAGYGCSFVDFDNDGDLDVFVAQSGANRLFENLGGGSFADAAETPVRDAASSAGAAWADYDGDGDLDLYLPNAGGANKLFRNDDPGTNRWIQVDLVGSASNRSGIGARVRVVAGGGAQIREVASGSGFLSQDALTAGFGLGASATIDSIIVRWPSGTVTDTANVAADQRITLFEETVQTGVAGGPPLPVRYELFGNAPNPFNPVTTVRFALPERSRVSLSVYDISGRLVRALKTGEEDAGWFSVTWNGRDGAGREVGSGIYFVRMATPKHSDTKKMVLIR